jgi:hypothetical protein
MKKGLIVFAKHPNFQLYYRAKITKITKRYVHLYFIDYGTKDVCLFEDVKYLLSEFLEIPPLCYRGRLYGVQPCEEIEFSLEQRSNFVKQVSGMALKCELKFYDEKQDVYELKIQCNSLSLDETLFKQGICKPIPKDVLNNRDSLTPYFYLLPSHQLLEAGKFPNYEALIDLEKRHHILFDSLMRTNYLHHLNVYNAFSSTITDMLKKRRRFARTKGNLSFSFVK